MGRAAARRPARPGRARRPRSRPARVSLAGLGRAARRASSSRRPRRFALARPLWVRGGGAPGIGRNVEPSASGLDMLTVFGLFFFLALAWWLVAAADGWPRRGVGRRARRGRRVAPRGRARALARAPARRVPARAASCSSSSAFFALAETREDRLAIGFVATRVLPRALLPALLHLRPDEHVLQALPRGLAALRDRDRRARLPRARAPRGDRRAGSCPPARASVAPGVAALFTTATAGARGASAATSRRTPARRSTACATSRQLAPGRVPRRRLAAAHGRGHARRARGAGPVVPGLRPHLDADGPADRARLGLPRQAARQLRDGDRGAPAGGQGDLLEPGRVAGRARSCAATTSATSTSGWLERKTYPAAGSQKFETDEGALRARLREPGDADLPRRRRARAGRARCPRGRRCPSARPRRRSPRTSPRRSPSILEKADAAEPPVREPARAARRRRRRRAAASGSPTSATRACASSTPTAAASAAGAAAATASYGFKELCGVAIRGDDALRRRHVERPRPGASRSRACCTASVARALRPARRRGRARRPRLGRPTPATTASSPTTRCSRIRRASARAARPPASSRARSASRSRPRARSTSPTPATSASRSSTADGRLRREPPVRRAGRGNAEPGLAVDADGTIYATDPAGGRRRRPRPVGQSCKRRIVADDAGRKFENPTGIAIDRKNRILYVVNSGNASVARSLSLGQEDSLNDAGLAGAPERSRLTGRRASSSSRSCGIAAGLTRFWALGARPLHHDESIHAYQSWTLSRGRRLAVRPRVPRPVPLLRQRARLQDLRRDQHHGADPAGGLRPDPDRLRLAAAAVDRQAAPPPCTRSSC